MGDINFSAPEGSILAKFMESDSYGRIIAGPVGSGKTTACIMELFRRAIEQAPADDGIRYSRFAVVRQTLKQLKDTVLKECENWLSSDGGPGLWKVSEGTFHVKFNDVVSEWIFIPLEDAQDQARLLSMQLTAAWLSECIEMNLDVVNPISGRLGRYPAGRRGAPTWYGMIADTNMPTELTPWHKFMEDLPANWQKFIQPSGLSPNAENLNYLLQTKDTVKLPLNHPRRIEQGRKYYDNLVLQWGEDHPWVNRYVKAQYGDDPSGMAVFKASFRPSFHIVPDTQLIPGYPLLIGQDFGRNPWSLICQPDHMGRLLVHEEVPATNIGLEKHVLQNLKPRLLSNKYIQFKMAVIGDPAGVAKDSHSEENSFDLIKRLGIPAFPSTTNDLDPRLRAVEALLGRQTNGGPTLLINGPGCPFLCRAMAGGYRFAKAKQGGLKPKPEKLDPEGYSHIADCLQYVALVVHGNLVNFYTQRIYEKKKGPQAPRSALGWT